MGSGIAGGLKIKAIIVDTSFLIRLLTSNDPLHLNARGYYEYFLSKQIRIKCSTISIGEYCVRASIDTLPLRQLEILPYNMADAVRSSDFAKIMLPARKTDTTLPERPIVINDIKLLAQADMDPDVEGFITSDAKLQAVVERINVSMKLSFRYINIAQRHEEFFGLPTNLFDGATEQ